MVVKDWTLKEKIGQMFIIAFGGEDVTPELEKAIAEWNVGGVILFQRNLRDINRVITLIRDIQTIAVNNNRPPLWISIDQEGGGIAYLWDSMVVSPGNMLIGATKSEKNAYDASFVMGQQLKKIGFNMNFAPDIDINNNPNNPVIGARSFGESPVEVSQLGKASIQGYHDAGVLAVGKHFPGHGDTEFDSHLSLPMVDKTLEQLESFELVPFMDNMNNNMEAIMTAHIVYPQLDSEFPATLSSYFLQTLLREKYEYDGLIITDSMEMDAIAKYFGREEGSVKAVQAGADIILACGRDVASQYSMVEAVERAVVNGVLPLSTVETAVHRILNKKKQWIDDENLTDSLNPTTIVEEQYHEVMNRIAAEGITLQINKSNVLPLDRTKTIKVIGQSSYNDISYMGDRKAIVDVVFAEERYEVTYISGENPTLIEIAEIVTTIQQGDVVVLLINERRELQRGWVKLVDQLSTMTENIIVVSLWNPQIIERLPKAVGTYITTFSYTDHTIHQLKKLLDGQLTFQGKSPVKLLEQGSFSYENSNS
ncbi:beta-N-acetylhexosaminidase [Sutcliffiella cohnii]|uniref:beta-N-acetylhexosaminidase n=1 Tax=Sutcliffiella cohnii TaxID=33932 RepID=UPI002E22A33A|nr:beta-N-acetylhexosaminidase [Sutcliffiella cohnii]MED4017846.1 beta-N-acetylhexosaminidase [Sutcliffiella cohnii]